MPTFSIVEQIGTIPAGGELRFTLREVPLDEVLLGIHEHRFTGSADVGAMPDVDRLYCREGAVVGVVPYRHLDAQLLGGILVDMKKLSRADLERVLAVHREIDGILLGQRLLEGGFIDEESLARAVAEQARRRLFDLYERPEAPVLLREGIERLAHFYPLYVDVRPAIAYGLVVRANPERKQEIVREAFGKKVRMIVPYDERRNSYGLPPPVLQAMRVLDGMRLAAQPCLPGLTPDTTAGVLLLLNRMSLLRFES